VSRGPVGRSPPIISGDRGTGHSVSRLICSDRGVDFVKADDMLYPLTKSTPRSVNRATWES
jgi:hypothetical protein